ncbi:hypothetical protein J1605_021908 [Eschrichtius robustus]|uniref:Uncharacterized protein n=1 Tax=Eschrichtius robustus TaxID=9764 RepID=A0AB34HEE6_ESCRO|nr:hypothetical protein J1605_021908 [Eschrichtius robustus]
MRMAPVVGNVALGVGCKGDEQLDSWPTWAEPEHLKSSAEDVQPISIPEEGLRGEVPGAFSQLEGPEPGKNGGFSVTRVQCSAAACSA